MCIIKTLDEYRAFLISIYY